MKHKKNRKKFPLAFKKKVGEATVSNKRKLEAEKAANVWNAKKHKWAKPRSQIRYKAMTVRELFSYMKEKNVIVLISKVVCNLPEDVKNY